MPTRLQRLTRSLSSRPWNGYQAKNCGILEHQNKNPKELLAFGFPASVLLCDRPRMDIVPDFKAPVHPASLFWRSLKLLLQTSSPAPEHTINHPKSLI